MKALLLLMSILALAVVRSCIWGDASVAPLTSEERAQVVAQEAEKKAKKEEGCKGTAQMVTALDLFSKHDAGWNKLHAKPAWNVLPVEDKKNVLFLIRNCLSKNTTVDVVNPYSGKRIAYYHNITGFGVD